MSVLECDRTGCNRVMCDRLIMNNRFYICDSCWNELLTYKASWPKIMLANEVKRLIENFMLESEPGQHNHSPVDVEEEFNRLTE